MLAFGRSRCSFGDYAVRIKSIEIRDEQEFD